MSIFYKAVIDVKQEEIEELTNAGGLRSSKLDKINQEIAYNFQDKKNNVLVTFASTNSEFLAFIAYDLNGCYQGEINIPKDMKDILTCVNYEINMKEISISEISAFDYNKWMERIDTPKGMRDLMKKRLGIEYTRGYYSSGTEFNLSDYVISEKAVTKTAAKKELKKMMPDDGFIEEIDRIYCKSHPNSLFYGIPCHYKVSVTADLVADEIIQLLVDCLYQNHRVLSKRITKIDDINTYIPNDQTFDEIMRSCQGSTMAIMLNGDAASEDQYASSYHQITDTFTKYIKKYAGEILFIFVENTSHPGFAKQLLGKVDEEIDIIEIKEGIGNGSKAKQYFNDLLEKSNMLKFYSQNDQVFDRKKYYSVSEVRSAFNRWRQERLRDRVYKAYDNTDIALKIDHGKKKKGSAYEELQALIGLSEIKSIINDIIAAYQVQKMRSEYYNSREITSRHMMFCGNPGSAKTTIARLMTEIMKENGILKTGTFIECGRSDLVGKYVGWTAKIVKDKFKQASGGVLFIDEAYSLVDDSNSFGAEAINTIVQEMENGRGDVIVIFAGYPEKMKIFLEQNEGLRSRIAFHVNFPDYQPEELMGILDKFSKDKKFTLTDTAIVKVKDIFSQVYTNKEYGNGRFVRNLFEQAINKQASRIMTLEKGAITKDTLFELQAEDFDTNIVKQYRTERNDRIGFI